MAYYFLHIRIALSYSDNTIIMDSLGLMSVSALSGPGTAPTRVYGFNVVVKYDSSRSVTITAGSFKYGIVTITAITSENGGYGGLPSGQIFYIGPDTTCTLSISGNGGANSARSVGDISSSAGVIIITAYDYYQVSGTIAIFA